MPLFPSDFKKLKFVESNDDFTILENPKGHQIRVAHKSLSPKMREQLMAMGGAVKADEQKCAEGGVLASARRSGYLGDKAKDTQSVRDAEDEVKAKATPIQGDTTKDVRTPEQKAKAEEYDRTGILPGYEAGGEVVNPLSQSLDEDTARARQIYNNMILGPTQGFSIGKGAAPVDEGMLFQPDKEPSTFNPDMWAKARQQQAQEKADNAAQVAAEQQKTIQMNQQRVDAGLTPMVVPDVPNGPQTELTQIPASTLSGGMAAPQEEAISASKPSSGITDPLSMLKQSYTMGKQAISEHQKAVQGLADEQVIAMNADLKAKTDIQQQFQQQVDALNSERQNLIQDIQDGFVDPNKFWEGDKKTGAGGHSRMAAAIGMIIAGFNPTNSPNAAIDFLKTQMEQNLDAQKANLSSKQNLLAHNLTQFKNIQDAMNMTRVMQADIVKNQLETAAAKAANPLAKAAAMQAISELDRTYSPLFQNLANNTAMANLMKNIQGSDTTGMNQMLDMMESVNPEKAKALRGRYIPDVGFAQTDKDATDLKEMRSGVLEAKSGIDKLKKIINKPLKSLTPSDRAEAETIQQTLVGALRLPITGPGAMNEGEREMLQKIIANPATIWSLDTVSKKKLDTLANSLEDKFAAAAKARGLEYKTESQKKKAQENQYIEWAKKNPNHPKAKLILQQAGK